MIYFTDKDTLLGRRKLYTWKEETLPSLILGKLSQRHDWTDFCSLQTGGLSFLLCQRRMSRLLSDHFPIVLEGGSF